MTVPARINHILSHPPVMIRICLIAVAALVSVSGSAAQSGQQGSGVIINPSGHILTNRHVVEGGCSQLYVESLSGRRVEARVVEVSDTDDLALLATGRDVSTFAYLRMNEKYDEGLLPVRGESVHIIGFPNGEFGPRGGFVERDDEPVHGTRGFTIGMSTTFGVSGGPVFDDDGLFVGLVWGALNDDSGAEPHVKVYALDAEAIIPFVRDATVAIGTSSRSVASRRRGNDENYFDVVRRVLDYVSPTLVKVLCISR